MHTSDNAAGPANVAVRPMRRDDLGAYASWGRHADPLFRHYNLPPLDAAGAADLWERLADQPRLRPYVGLEDGRVVATILLRDVDLQKRSGELGIMLDPARIGRGLGRRILRAFIAVLAEEGFQRLRLEAAAYNGRALAAYRACGFAVTGEAWVEPEPGIDLASLLDGTAAAVVRPNVRRDAQGRYRVRVVRMERRIEPDQKDTV